MVNFKLLSVFLFIVLVVLIGIMFRCMCWNWCKRNYCPDGCCNDDPVRVYQTDAARVDFNPEFRLPPTAPPPEIEGEQIV